MRFGAWTADVQIANAATAELEGAVGIGIGIGISIGGFRSSTALADYDFSRGVVPNGLTFTRSSAATYVNTAGEPVAVASGVARFENNMLLMEASQTNFVTRSSDTAAYPWTLTPSGGITATVSARGTRNGVPYTDFALSGSNASVNTYPFKNKSISATAATSAQVWTASVYCELVSGSWPAGVSLQINAESYDSGGALIGQATGSVTPTAAPSRAVATRTITASGATAQASISLGGMGAAGATTFTGQVLRVYGWQLEQAASATSLIQTLGGVAVTRAADSIAPTDVRGWPLANGYTIYAEGRLDALVASGSSAIFVQIDDGTNSNRVYLGPNSSVNVRAAALEGGAQVGLQSATPTFGPYKIIASRRAGLFQSAIRGVAGTQTTPAGYTRPIRLTGFNATSVAMRQLYKRVWIESRVYNAAQQASMTA